MNNLDELNIRNTLPNSIEDDKNIQALSEILTVKLISLMPFVDKLTLLTHLNELEESILDELAWHLHVDFYDDASTREKKVNLILNSIAWHRRKGTVGLVEEAITTVYSECEVLENWEYDKGQPYHFKLRMTGYLMSNKIRTKLMRLLETIKNKRSWIDEIEYIHNIRSGINYMGGVTTTAGVVNISPNLGVSIKANHGVIGIGGCIKIYRSIVI